MYYPDGVSFRCADIAPSFIKYIHHPHVSKSSLTGAWLSVMHTSVREAYSWVREGYAWVREVYIQVREAYIEMRDTCAQVSECAWVEPAGAWGFVAMSECAWGIFGGAWVSELDHVGAWGSVRISEDTRTVRGKGAWAQVSVSECKDNLNSSWK